MRPPDDSYDARLRREADTELCRRGRTGIVILPAILLAVLFSTSVPQRAPGASTTAIIALCAVCLVRLYDTLRFNSYDEQQRRAWKLRFWFTFQASAAVFSAMGCYVVVVLFGRHWEPIFYLMAVATITTGGVTALAPDIRIMRQYLFVQLIPLGLAFLYVEFWGPGISVFLYGLYWLGQGSTYSRAYWSALHTQVRLQAKSEALERAVGELTEAAERFRSAFETAPIGVGIIRYDGKLLRSNEQMATTLGIPKDQLPGLLMSEVFEDEEQGRRFLAALRNGAELECELQRPDGGRVWLLFKAGSQPEKDESMDCFIGQFVDVTQRKLAESALFKTQKMQSLGVLAAGIAHELNSPLQFTSDNIHFLSDSWKDLDEAFGRLTETRKRLAEQPEKTYSAREVLEFCPSVDVELLADGHEALADTASGLSRMSAIVASIRAVTYGKDAEKRPVDITATITHALAVSTSAWERVAQLETHFHEDLPLVEGDESELGQVFLNLIVNAAQAMEEAGSGRDDTPAKLQISTRRDQEFVEVRVSDSGLGIDGSIADKIFDPFFTTKDVGKGTGQGLAFSRSAVNRHGGTITFESRPGLGTTFVVRLPLMAA